MSAPNPATSGTGHIIAVVGGKGGVGKSVFAANFAIAVAADMKNGPALIDFDPAGSGDINMILGIKQVQGFGDAILDGKVRDPNSLRALFKTVQVAPACNLHVLQMAQSPERLMIEDEEKLDAALKFVRKNFPLTIVDCGSRIEGGVMKVLDNATLVLVVTNPEVLVLNQTRKAVDRLQVSLYPNDIIKIVLNKVPTGSPYTPQFIEQTLKRQVISVIPEDVVSAQGALAKGAPLAMVAQGSPITKALFSLSRLIVEKRVLETLAPIAKPVRPRGPSAGEMAMATGGKDNIIPLKKGPNKDPSDPRSVLRRRMHGMLIDRMDLKAEQLTSQMAESKKVELKTRATKILTDLLTAEDHPFKSRDETQKIIKEVLDETFGLGPLEDLLADDEVKEIMVNRADLIYIERNGMRKTLVTFSSNEQVVNVIRRIVSPLGRVVNESRPYVDARLPDGSRVHAIIPPLAIDGPMITIRKFPKSPMTIDTLIKFGALTKEMAEFLKIAVEEKRNIVISGGTGSGKTSLLNVLSSFIPSSERIITVEDAAELQLVQEHVARLESRPAGIEGGGEISIRELVKQTLRMRPDRIIIGEVRDGTALDMLAAMNTGHDGSMATVHSNSARECLIRLQNLVQQAGFDMPVDAIKQQISSTVHYIVQASRLADGSRKVTSITEVCGMQGETITTQPIFEFRETGLLQDLKASYGFKIQGSHVPTGFIPKFLEILKKKGKKVPDGLFKAA